MAQPAEMSTTGARPESPSPRKIEYLSPPAEVSMADRWFAIASTDHFWIRRRFEVFQKLAGHLIGHSSEMAEIGCGQGLVQRQIEQAYGRPVTGFDLNETGLAHNLSKFSRVCCYDIYQREPALAERFDLIFLWDVIEHIEAEDRFIQAILFHLVPGGKLVVNVPAGEWAFSRYDLAAGHVRRYSPRSLLETSIRNGLVNLSWSYWGLPLLPAIALRKLWLVGKRNQDDVITSGFDSRSSNINRALGMLSRCEVIPQRVSGTSLMAVLQRKS